MATGNETIASNVSTASSLWVKNSTKPEIEEFQAHRDMLLSDHVELMDRYAFVMGKDEIYRPAHTDEFDGFRRQWWKKVMEFVSLARERFEAGRLSKSQFYSAAKFVDGHVRLLWSKTRYFANDMPPSPIPTIEETMEPLPNSGQKRALNDFSLGTDAFADMPHSARFRTSSPNPDSAMDAEVEEVNIGRTNNFLRPTSVPLRRQSVGHLPSRGLPVTPTPNENVEKWLQAATPSPAADPETPALSQSRLHVRAALIKAKERDSAQQREIEELKRRLEQDANAALEAATAAILEREKEVQAKVTAEANRRYEVEAERHRVAIEKLVQDKMAAIEEAKKAKAEAAASSQQLQTAVINAQAEATAEKSKRLRTEETARKATEARQIAEDAVENQRRMIEQQRAAAAAAEATAAESERRQREVHFMLPSTTPANPPTSAEKNKKKRSSPKKAANQEHPLHAALRERQTHSATIDITGNETSMETTPINSETSLPTGMNVLSRLMGDCVIKMDWSGMNPETIMRMRQMDVDSMKESRPRVPFSKGNAIEYSLHMSAFEEATKLATVSFADKLKELTFWFEGTAKDIILQHKQDPKNTDQTALALAISELDSFFKEAEDAVAATLAIIKSGKQLNAYDYQGHMELHAELRRFKLTAHLTNSTSEFQRRMDEIMSAVFDYRFGHRSAEFWRENQKSIRSHGKKFNFDDLLIELQDWCAVLKQNNPKNGKSAHNKAANVAAVSSTTSNNAKKQSLAKRVANSPPKPQNTNKCTICGHLHPSQECNVLAEMSVEKRLETLNSRQLCYHCFQDSHIAKACTQRPVCRKCSRRHATLLHDRKFDAQPRTSTLSSNALPFRPMQKQSTDSSTTPNASAAPSQATTL